MYTISAEKLQEFVNKTTFGGLVPEFLMEFSKKGITIVTSMISVVASKGHLPSTIFDLYDDKERIVGIKTKILSQTLSRYKGEIKMEVDDNSSLLIITGKGKDGRSRQVDIPLIDKEYVKVDEKSSNNVDRLFGLADDGVSIKTDVLKEAIANKKISANDDDTPLLIQFTGNTLKLKLSSTDVNVEDIIENINYPKGKGLYGNYLDEIIKVVGDDIIIAFQKEMRDDGPLLIKDGHVFFILAPRME